MGIYDVVHFNVSGDNIEACDTIRFINIQLNLGYE